MTIRAIVGLIPVILLLLTLLYLDSMKLVSRKTLMISLLWGLIAAALSYFLNTELFSRLSITFSDYSRFIAPFVEEVLKCGFLFYLIRRNRIGFMIDGAIYGFAIGTAFAFAENIFYLATITQDAGNLMIWITRGFGTAVMHGGTVAVFGILAMSALNRKSNLQPATFTGIGSAILLHGLYNQFLVSPVISTVLVLILVPVSITLIFVRNERTIRNWLELEFESEAAMLRMIRKGKFLETRQGSYLASLKEHIPAERLVDLYCFITLYLELSIRAKSLMMLRENDIVAPPDPGIREQLQELKALQKNIGRAGFLAIAPIFRMNRKDLWKLSILEKD